MNRPVRDRGRRTSRGHHLSIVSARTKDRRRFYIRPDGDRWAFGYDDTILDVFDSMSAAVDTAMEWISGFDDVAELVILDEKGDVAKHVMPEDGGGESAP